MPRTTISGDQISDGTIADVDVSVSAAIQGSKINPNFSGDINTSGVYRVGGVQIALANLSDGGKALYYDISGQAVSTPTASQVLINVVLARAVTFGLSFPGSFGKSGVAATGTSTFTIGRNGTQVGSMVFAASATTATFTGSSSFSPGDVLTVVAPATPDVTLANITFVLAGSL